MNAGRQAPGVVLLTEEVWGSALHAMRELDRGGVATSVVTFGRGAAILGRSRHCHAALDLPPGADPIPAALDWAQHRHPGAAPVAVVPLSDRLADLLDRRRDELPPRFRPALPEPGVLAPLLDKPCSLRLAAAAGLHVPRWATVRTRDDLAAVKGLELPVAVRPTGWRTAGRRPHKISVHHDTAILIEALRGQLDAGAELLVQEYLQEPEDAVEFALVWRARDRTSTVVCTGRKRRQSGPAGGVMAWGQTAALPDVADAAQRFLDHAGYVGLGGIELIRTSAGLRFIEFNPRLEAIHFLGSRAGVDTLRLEVAELTGFAAPALRDPPVTATAWVGSAWLARLRSDPGSWRLLLRDRLRFARSPRRIRAVWSWTDPLPALALVWRLLSRWLDQKRSDRVTR